MQMPLSSAKYITQDKGISALTACKWSVPLPFKNRNQKVRAPAVAGSEELLQAMGDTI